MRGKAQLAWPDNLTSSDRLTAARDRVEKLIDHWTLAIAVRESNVEMSSAKIRNQIPKSYGANCYNTLLYSQLRYELICLTVIWDKSKKDRDSILTVFDLINDSNVRAAIIANAGEQYRQDPSQVTFDTFIDRRRKEEIARAKAELNKLKKLVNLIPNHYRVKKIIAYRDETIAHSLSKNTTNIVPYVIPSAKGIWDLTEKCIQLLNSLVRNSSFDFTGSAKMHRRNAEYFWGGMKITMKK